MKEEYKESLQSSKTGSQFQIKELLPCHVTLVS